MNFNIILENLTNPSLLFFILGLISSLIKSDLKIPETSSKFISIYLLFSIGFKGGQELSHNQLNSEILNFTILSILLSVFISFYTFFILKRKLNIWDSTAICASYGSVSAVTFITTINYLELNMINFDGYMVAIMALMEAPSIIVALLLYSMYGDDSGNSIKSAIKHSFTNGSVLLVLGSLFIGFIASEKQALGIEPFTTDIFKGFLSIFLLDMGISSGSKLKTLFNYGIFPVIFATLIPLFNGVAVSFLTQFITDSDGNRLILSILAASASYIAVPAAMKLAVPKSNQSLYVPMSLGITFPFNIIIGIPIYHIFIKIF